MALTGRVDELGLVETVDRLGDEALVERMPRGLDLFDAVAARRFRLGEDALVGRGNDRRAERLVGMRGPAVDQPHLAGARPFGLEVLDRRDDRRDDARHQREAMLGVADRIGEHIAQLERAVVAKQQHPAVERAGHDSGKQPRAGHLRKSHPAQPLGARRRREWPLPADHLRRVCARAHDDRRQLAARSVEMRLDDLQHKTSSSSSIKRIAAALQHRHAGLRGEPVRGRDRAEGAADVGTCGESGLHRGSVPACIMTNHDLVHHRTRSLRRLRRRGCQQVLRRRRHLPAWRRRRRRALDAGIAEPALGLSRHAAVARGACRRRRCSITWSSPMWAAELRQFHVHDANGGIAVHTGARCIDWCGHVVRPGNLGCGQHAGGT